MPKSTVTHVPKKKFDTGTTAYRGIRLFNLRPELIKKQRKGYRRRKMSKPTPWIPKKDKPYIAEKLRKLLAEEKESQRVREFVLKAVGLPPGWAALELDTMRANTDLAYGISKVKYGKDHRFD